MNINERDVETSIDKQLKILGYVDDIESKDRNVYKQGAKTEEQKKILERKKPDFILYEKNTDNIIAIIEVKKFKDNLNLHDALEQAKGYASKLKCKIVFATDGYNFKSYNLNSESPLLLNYVEIKSLPSYEILLEYQKNYNYLNQGLKQNKEALIKYYNRANDILQKEGLNVGIDRFSEFAKLIFYKMILEKDKNVINKKWEDINIKNPDLIRLVNNDLEELSKHYNNLVSSIRIKDKNNLQDLLYILNEINFSLTDTDYKGDAFEYFIHSYTKGANNDLGQYFTPRHIVKLCVSLADLEKQDTIYDPFCGTGGMLIEAFKYLREFCNDEDLANLKDNTIYGNELSDTSNIAKMNMICAGDGHNNINQKDSYKNKVDNKYEKVITNIPFSQDASKYNNLYNCPIGSKKNGDIIGVLHCLYSIKKGEKACAVIIVPIGLLYKKETKWIREYIYNNYTLDTVVELHEHVFQPYTMQHTAILKIKNKINKEINESTPYFKYYKIENDGFSKNAYRIVIKENDLEKVINNQGYQKILMTKEWEIDGEGYEFKKLSFNKYGKDITKKVTTKALGDFCEILKGIDISPNKNPELFSKICEKDNMPFYMAEDLSRNHITFYLNSSRQYIKKSAIKDKNKILEEKVILLVTSGQSSLKNHRALTAVKSVISSTITGIKIKDLSLGVTPEYLLAFFEEFDFKNITYDYGYPGTRIDLLKKIIIPINYDILKRKSELTLSLQDMEKHYNKMLNKYQNFN